MGEEGTTPSLRSILRGFGVPTRTINILVDEGNIETIEEVRARLAAPDNRCRLIYLRGMGYGQIEMLRRCLGMQAPTHCRECGQKLP